MRIAKEGWPLILAAAALALLALLFGWKAIGLVLVVLTLGGCGVFSRSGASHSSR